MPLLTPTATIDAAIDQQAKTAASHLRNIVSILGQMANSLLDRDPEALTGWLNSRTPEETLGLFTVHGQAGEAVNAMAELIGGIVGEELPRVDVRSVPEKLLERGKLFSMDEKGVFAVTRIPDPEPTTEPESEPTPDPTDEPEPEVAEAEPGDRSEQPS